LKVVIEEVGIGFEEFARRYLAFKRFQNQVHGEGLRTSGFACNYQGNLIQDASYDDKYVLGQGVVSADACFDLHLVQEAFLLPLDDVFEPIYL